VGAVALLAAPVGAQNWECSTGEDFGGWGDEGWTVTAEDPVIVDCANATEPDGSGDYQLVENASGDCTGIQYDVTGIGGDHAYILALPPIDEDALKRWSADTDVGVLGLGDGKVDLGLNSYHEHLITYNSDNSANYRFFVIANGKRTISSSTVAFSKGRDKGYCQIAAVGPEPVLPDGCVPSCGNFDEDQSLIKSEVIDFKGCGGRFEYNLATGAVLRFGAACDDVTFPTVDNDECCLVFPDDPNCTPLSATPCEFPTYDAETGTVKVILEGIQHTVNFGDGLVSIGDESCSCRVIGGRLYCWGKNCPER